MLALALSAALEFVARGQMPAARLPMLADGSLRVFVRWDGAEADLRNAGIQPFSHAGRWWTGRIQPSDLSRIPSGMYVEEAHLVSTQLDQSVPATGTIVARQADPTLDGRDVVVGIVDTGIDWTHPDFRNPDGTTRIVWLQDVSNGPGGLHSELATAPDAQVWSQTDLNRAIAQVEAGLPGDPSILERDTSGHGTHVTGIAAGSGRATGHDLPAGRYVGMAPAADLVIAKGTRPGSNGFTDADLADGAAFIFARADELGEPAAVNLSVGAQSTAHVGHSAMEDMLAAEIGAGMPGRIIVAAAGNDGASDIHASGALLGEAEETVPIDVGVYRASQNGSFGWEIWYPDTGKVSILVRTPSGAEYGPVPPGRMVDFDTPDGHIYVANAQNGPDGASHRNGAYCSVQQSDHAIITFGRWDIVLTGRSTRWDLWISGSNAVGPVNVRGFLDPDDHLTIPGTAEDILSVASFTTKSIWTSFLGTHVDRDLTVGFPSTFSSTGPTADGRFKPDLAAPGEYIASSLSADAHPSEPGSVFFTLLKTLWADDGVHGLLRGTSMATPHVTGAAALILEKRPDLDAPRLRELLRATARAAEPRGFGPKWGYGKLAVDLAAKVATGHFGQTVDPMMSAVGVSRDVVPPDAGEDSIAVVTVVPKDATGLPLGPGHAVEITGATFDGDTMMVSEWGRWERRLIAGARGGSATVTVKVDGTELSYHPTVFFADSHGQIGVADASGCAVARGGGGWLLIVISAWSGMRSIVRARRRTRARRHNRRSGTSAA